MQQLCLEERYDRAIALADEYWFSHPCSIDDVISGQNTLYKDLSKSEILFRLRLASYTKTALIGSGTLVSRFFSYYRTPEIYNEIEDYVQREPSLAGMLRQRALDNPTAVYYLGINAMEREGVSGEGLSLMVPAMLACEQKNLAEKYIRAWAGLKGWKKEAARYAAVLDALRNPDAAENPQAALAQEITAYGQKGLTDYLNDEESVAAECRARWAQNPASQGVLECVLLYDLLYKDLEHAASLLPAYLRLSGQSDAPAYEIPLPLQEMFRIMQTEGMPVADSIETLLPNVAWNEEAARNFGRFLHARAQWQRGLKTPAELTSEFGSTFAYNYYFSRFITPPAPTDNTPH
ncbi:MAG: hypothetical protein K2I66_05050, partial [Bacteroidales bacterium]|nr:hypothetical protein [Bacteroidales bacterium]